VKDPVTAATLSDIEPVRRSARGWDGGAIMAEQGVHREAIHRARRAEPLRVQPQILCAALGVLLPVHQPQLEGHAELP